MWLKRFRFPSREKSWREGTYSGEGREESGFRLKGRCAGHSILRRRRDGDRNAFCAVVVVYRNLLGEIKRGGDEAEETPGIGLFFRGIGGEGTGEEETFL